MALLAYHNAVDFEDASITATNESTGLPATNIQDPDIGTKVFRTTANKTALDIRFSSLIDRQVVVLIGTNLTGSASITLDTGSKGAGSSDVLSAFRTFKISETYRIVIGVISGEATFGTKDWGEFLWGGGGTLAQDWRLTISDPSLSNIDIGRVGLLKSLDLERNIEFGWSMESIPMTTLRRMRGGQVRSYRRRTYYGAETYKKAVFSWRDLLSSDAIALIKNELFREVGQGEDILFVENLEDPYWSAQAVWGPIMTLPPAESIQTAPIRWTLGGFEVEEQL